MSENNAAENNAAETVTDTINTAAQGGFEVRTDLALEQKESFEGDGGEISGVKLKEWHHQKSQVKLTEVKILNEQGAKAMGKPKGTYLTLEADRLSKADDEYHSEISEELARQIRKLMGEMIGWKEEDLPSVLVVGLGNSSVTPDSLGPRVLGNLQVTRHLDGQYGDTFLKDVYKRQEVKNLTKTFHQTKEGEGNQVLKDVNFSVDENEFVVVFGPGQCGKTTLLNIIAGLEEASSGEVYIRGKKAEKPRCV